MTKHREPGSAHSLRPRNGLVSPTNTKTLSDTDSSATDSAARGAAYGAETSEADNYDRLDEAAALRTAVRARVDEALQRIIAAVPREELYAALSTSSSIDAVIHLVSRESAVAQAVTAADNPLRAARARAAKRMSGLLGAEGGPLGVEAVSGRLRITRAAVDKRRRAGTLIGIDDGGRAILYPGWQFTETGLLPGLEDVLRALTVRDPWMRMEFFLSSEPDLGASPLDALRNGRNADVVAAARRYGRQGDDG